MTLDAMIAECCAAFDESAQGITIHVRDDINLAIVRDRAADVVERQVYMPLFCLVLQGRKEIIVGPRRLVMGSGDVLVVSHDLPVATKVLEGSADHPYLAMVIRLNVDLLRSLYAEVGDSLPPASQVHSADVGKADPPLIEAMGRLLELRRDTIEAKVLGPVIQREIHFRLLKAYHGGMLRELLRVEGYAGRVAKAIRHIQDNYREPLAVGDLAALSAMSLSSFHHHFKVVAGRSPLQYQKAIRLLEARRLLADGDRTVAGVAMDVGYESPTQFSREYSREFGHAPRRQG